MKKKIVLFLVTALLMAGTAWAQLGPFGPGDLGLSPAAARSPVDYVFGSFNAFPAVSTEFRYSAGIFYSDIDNYLDVSWFDPDIGTFFFLGATPAAGPVDVTDYLSGANSISLGFARTFEKFYLGAYYGGNIVNAIGEDTGLANDFIKGEMFKKHSYREWRNNLAVIVGLDNLGAFRFDFIMNTDTRKDKAEDGNHYLNRTNAPSLALTWGGLEFAGIKPYITVGYKFSEKTEFGDYFDAYGNKFIPGVSSTESFRYQSASFTHEAGFGVELGGAYEITDNSNAYLTLGFRHRTGRKWSGDSVLINSMGLPSLYMDALVDPYSPTFNVSEDGEWAMGVELSYDHTLTFGIVSLGFAPALNIAYLVDNQNVKGKRALDVASNNYFQLNTTVDLGIKVTPIEKLSFYTGASLQIIDWRRLTHRGGKHYPVYDGDFGHHNVPGGLDTRYSAKHWQVSGVEWDQNIWGSSSNLGFGMTFTPVKNLIIGLGLNTFLDKFFAINLETMSIESGSFWNDNGENNVGSWAGGIFRGMKLDLTVSYKF